MVVLVVVVVVVVVLVVVVVVVVVVVLLSSLIRQVSFAVGVDAAPEVSHASTHSGYTPHGCSDISQSTVESIQTFHKSAHRL
jgi:hypothetical protein